MVRPARLIRDLFRRASPARDLPKTGYKLVDAAHKFQEENWSWYSPDVYYPVKLGEIFQSRYQVLTKLGYGTHSTAWLCRDLKAHKYIALKVCDRASISAQREVEAFRHLDSIKTKHAGSTLLRRLLDVFEIHGYRDNSKDCSKGKHLCLVHEPLGYSIQALRELMPERRLPIDVAKALLRCLLRTLDFLHTEAKMVHADLQTRNLLAEITDQQVLKDMEDAEMTLPSERKIDGDRIIYESRGFPWSDIYKMGHPILSDFGEARYGQESYTDDIQPDLYRAPEVILEIPWSYPADIWNLGVLTWNFVEGESLFKSNNLDRRELTEYHLAQMVALMGPPPIDFLQRSEIFSDYFDEKGHWTAESAVPDISLETCLTVDLGDEKAKFLSMIRRMLQWSPEDRSTAAQLFEDPWLDL